MKKLILLTLTTLLSCWTFGVTKVDPNRSPGVLFSYTDSMKVGGKYIFNCEILTEGGTYVDIIPSSTPGKDSVVYLTLTEYTPPVPPCEEVTFAYADSVETGGTYIFNCRVLTAAGTYKDTLIKADGCDSIVVLTLTEYTPVIPCEDVTFAYADSVETGGTYIFNCRVLTAAGTYKDTLIKADGCDSIVVLTLTEYTLPVPPCEEVTFAYADSIETGGTYIFNCRVLTAAGTYKDTLIKADGCDSIVVLTLTEYTPVIPCEEVTFAYADSVETGGTYIFNCRTLTEAGEYRDTLVKADGCDSIVVLTLTEYIPVPPCKDTTIAYTDSVAVGGKYIFNCQTLTAPGEYRDTLAKADGCDSIVVLTLTEYTPVIPCEDVTFAYTDSVETGGTYIFNCRVLTAAGTYKDTLIKADGCDSIVVLTLTEYTPIIPCEDVTFAYTDSVETGGTYIFNCRVLTGVGTYRDTLVKADGCDSIVVLTLTEYIPVPPCKDTTIAYTDSVAVGGKYIFNCRTLTEAGEYRDTLVKADGCDSIVVLTLTEYTPYIPPVVVHDTVTVDSIDAFCRGTIFVSRLQTITLNQDTAFADTIRDIQMSDLLIRDSIYTYQLTALLPTTGDTTAYVCQGDDFYWHGAIAVDGDTWTTTNVAGCDSVVTLHIIDLLPTTGDTTAYVCQGDDFYWHGAIAVDGDTWTTTNVAGCDSVVTLHIIDLLPTTGDTTAYVCQGDDFYWHGAIAVDGDTWTTTNVAGCDSVVTLHIIDLLPTTGDTTAYVCQGDDFYWHGAIAVDGDTWTTTNVAGCDSVVTLHIIDLLPTTGDTTAYVCQGDDFYWHGAIAIDGDTWTTTNVAGCDSVVTLHIIDLLPTTGDTTAYVCQGDDFYWHGAIAIDGDTWTTTNVAGCDSVVTLHIIDLLPTTGDTTAYVCQGDDFYWHGAIAVDGDTWTTTNVAGCDSVVTLHIIDLLPTTGDTTAYVCQGDDFYWHGAIAVDGDTWTTTNVAGCDSVVTLHIIDLLPTTGDTTAYVCQGDDFYWHGAIAVDGDTWTTTNVAGCDSVVTLHIIDLLPTTGDTTAYVCQGDDFYWHGAIAVDGDTWTTTNVAGCDSVVTLHLIPQPTSVDTLPAFAKDNNWLLMFGRKQVRDAYRLEPTEAQVSWFRVEEGGDKFLKTGYYYTEGQALVGDYYAKITGIDLSPLGACVTEARTITLHCGPANLTPRLAPTIVGAGQPMELSNLDANEESQIVIYNVAGSVIRQFRVQGNETFQLTADETCGLYLLHVENGHQSTTLKYIVNQ